MGAVATWFDQTFVQPARFFFTGEYSGTEGNDVIMAVNIFGNWRGGEAKIYAGGGNDDIYMASIATTVYTGTGNDRIFGIAASMTVRDDWGNLEIYGAGGAFNIYKNGDGWVYVGAAAAYANIDSRGNGDVTFSGAAAYSNVTKVGNGHINFNGLAGGTRVYHSGWGDINFYGAAGSNNVEKYGDGHLRFYGAAGAVNIFQRGYGDVWINGAAGYASVRKEGGGNISFAGAAGGVNVSQSGNGDIYFAGAGGGVTVNKNGNGQITLYGAAASTTINQTGAGNITFGGAGAHAQINKTGANGDITVQGGVGNINVNYRQGNGNIVFQGAAGNINLSQDAGNIVLHGAAASATINKYSNGNVEFKGAAANANINQSGSGNISIAGVAGGARVNQTGNGNISFAGAAGGVNVSQTGNGDIYFAGAGGGVTVNKNGNGQITLYGAAASTTINQTGAGNITFGGAGAHAQINKTGANGDITVQGGVGNVNVNYSQGAGNIVFQGAAGNINLSQDAGNIVLHGVAASATINKYSNGNIEFKGAAANANINQSGSGNISIAGVAGGARVNQTGNGNISFAGAAGGVNVSQTGNGDIYFAGAGGGVTVNKNGNGQISLYGAAVSTTINQTGTGNITFGGVGAHAQINKTAQARIQEVVTTTVWETRTFNWWGWVYQYQVPVTRTETRWIDRTTGDVVVQAGVGNVNVNYSQGAGNIVFQGAAGNVNLAQAKGDVVLYGAVGAATINKTGDGNIDFKGAAGGIDLNHTGDSGTINVNGAAAYSKIVRRSNNNNSLNNHIYFYGAGAYSNVLQQANGNIDFKGAGVANVLTHNGTYGHTSFVGAGGANIITHTAIGDINFNGAGAANIIKHNGATGNTNFAGAGGANVIIHTANGEVSFNGAGIANVIFHKGNTGNANINAGGALNLVVRQGNGNTNLTMAALGNVAVHLGNGNDRVFQLGGLNTYTRVGDGNTLLGLAGGLNVATLIGNGSVYGALLGAGNVVTKIGTGDSYIATIGAGNVVSQIDNSTNNSQTAALMLGGANILTKSGQGDLYGVMAGGLNVATHVGAGNDYMAQLGGGNVLTKVGQGNLTAIQFGLGNIQTHVGNGTSLGVMAGGGNIYTKVGNGLSASLMLGTTANVFTHVGSGDSLAIMASQGGNLFTKVDVNSIAQSSDITAAAMLGTGNAFTHVGSGTTGALMLAGGNLFTKVGDGNTAAAMVGVGNIATHVGNGSLIAVMGGVPVGVPSGNVLTKVGNGTTVGVMAASGNIFTHVGDGNTTGVALGQGNIITKVGKGDQVNAVLGQGNVLTHVTLNNATNTEQATSNNSYNLAIGKANIVTKVGDGKQVSALVGDANVMTHVGDGDAINLAIGGKANIVTKVGDGNTVTGLLNGQANIITHVGDGNDYQGVWGKANIVTKVGDGTSASAMKGTGNIVTAVGDGAQVGILVGDGNIVTKVGDGVSVNLLKGQANINTKVGDGTTVAVMMGTGNANIQVGDGTTAFVAYANNNISIKVGDGDYYGLAFAKGKSTVAQNAQAVGRSLFQSAAGFVGSGVISQLIWGAEETGHGETQNQQGDVSEKVVAEPNIAQPSFDFNKFSTTPSFKSNSGDVQVSEPNPSSNLNRDNIEQINSNQQTQQAGESRAGANAAELAIKKGIDNARADVNGLFNVLESAVGDGGALQSILDTASNALITQLSALNGYVGQLDNSLQSKSNHQQGQFANGIIGNVNTQLNSTLQSADAALDQSDKAVGDAKLQIERVKQDAQLRQTVAADAQSDALTAQQAANQQKLTAENRVTGAQGQATSQQTSAQTRVNSVNSNAAGAKLSDADKPNRTAANGSGLTGNVTSLDSIEGFNTKSDVQLATTATNIVSQSQQAALQNGVTGIAITPLVLGQGVPSLPQDEEEEENEGGLTDEQIAALHEAERANNNLGLKGSWRTSVEVKQWMLNGDEALQDSIRNDDEKPNKKLRRGVNKLTNAAADIKPLIEQAVDSHTQGVLTKIREKIQNDNESQLFSDYRKIREEVVNTVFQELKNKVTQDDIKRGDIIKAFEQLRTDTLNRTDFRLSDREFIESKIKEDKSLLGIVSNKRTTTSTYQTDTIFDAKTYQLLKAADIESLLLHPLIGEFKNSIAATIKSEYEDNDIFSGGTIVEDETSDLLRQMTEVAEGKKIGISYKIPERTTLFDGDGVHTASEGAEADKFLSGKAVIGVGYTLEDGTTEQFEPIDPTKPNSYRNSASPIRQEAFGWINDEIDKLRADQVTNKDKLDALKALKAGLKKYKRDESSADSKKFNDYTTAKISGEPYEQGDKKSSINHILADSVIASLVHLLAYQAKFGDDAAVRTQAEEAAKALFKALAGVDDPQLKQYDSEKIAKNAFDKFKGYVNNTANTSQDLYDAIHTISYAPANVRYGNRAINSTIGNYFDPILKYDATQSTIVLETNTAKIVEAVKAVGEVIDKRVDENAMVTEDAPKPRLISEIALTLKKETDGNGAERILTSSHIQDLPEAAINTKKESHKFDVTKDEAGKFSTIGGHNTDTLLSNLRASTDDLIEPSSGIDKLTKRIDYKITHQATTEAGDKITVYQIANTEGGKPLYRVQIDIGSDEKKRISVFASENPVQANGTIKLPTSTTVVSHGEKIQGSTYTSQVDSSYLGEDGKYLSIGANDFRQVENLTAADSVAKSGQSNNYLLTKYRGDNEGLDIDTAKNQEQILLSTLNDRSTHNKDAVGYMTVGKHAQVTSQEAEAALSRLGVAHMINGYCRALPDTPKTADKIYSVQVSDPSTHNGNKAGFIESIKRTIEDVAIVRQTDLEGHRTAAREAAIHKAETIGSKIKRQALHYAPQTTVAAIKSAINTNGNIQIQVGNGEYTAGFWGNTNIGVKVGDGGFKTMAFGNNNAMIHIGNGDNAQHTVKVANYTAFESVQLFMGEHNISYNKGRSNDFIVMLDKSVPLAPFQSPLSGPSDIVGFLKNDIANFKINPNAVDPLTGEKIADNYYDSQSFLWTNSNAKQIISQISALDMNSAVEYDTLFNYGSQNDRSDRALKADLERKANGMFNQALAGQSPLSMAKNRNLKDQNFNITVAGQGSDIVIANGDNQFMFGDNAQSIMDTTIASLFGVLSQDVGRNGQVSNPLSVSGGNNAKEAFLNTLKNLAQDTFSRVMARTAAGLPDMSFGEVFGIDYNADGQVVIKEAGSLSIEELLAYKDTSMQGILGVMGNFGNTNLATYLNSSRLIDTVRTAANKGMEGAQELRDSLLGVQPSTPDATEPTPADTEQTPPSEQSADNTSTQPTVKSSEVFGFGALKLPSIFDFDISAGFSAVPDMLNTLVGTINSFDGDINTMKAQMFDFFSKSGYMQGDGDLMLSLGNNNFAWGGDGADIAAFMGLNNNFWGGRGNDMYYGIGENNQASGNDGDDTAVLLGINNIFFGGDGKDFALASGRNGNLAGGNDDDTLYALGDTSWLNGGTGNDYLVAVGNYNGVDSGDGNDFVVSIGNFADVNTGKNQDVVSVFGNSSTINTGEEDDLLRLMGHQSHLLAGSGNDFIWTDAQARNNVVDMSDGNDVIILGGNGNIFTGGAGVDTFVINDAIVNAQISDINQQDQLVFADMSFEQIWFAKNNTDLVIHLDNERSSTLTVADYFNQENRADIVVSSFTDATTHQVKQEVLTVEAVDKLIQVMASYDITNSEESFMSGVSTQDKQLIVSAWDSTTIKLASV